MRGVEKICLSCRHFRLHDVDQGVCRVNKASDKNYPVKARIDRCGFWQDCGQQYFIRLGWIKGKNNTKE